MWGYNELFPGPTIRVRSGRAAVVRFANKLPDGGFFEFGDAVPFRITVTGPEDGANVDCSKARSTTSSATTSTVTRSPAPRDVRACYRPSWTMGTATTPIYSAWAPSRTGVGPPTPPSTCGTSTRCPCG
ncbi:MAG: multicopper oxidase domain-containing protein [Rubrobacter sp.]|nr:multicopper oxidase domain-containing protein [Rubrobacter sp.]MBA3792961.1 multicopper oxidase domain-containing protein [Rubrobacter sp.]